MISEDYSAGLMSQSFWFVEFKKYLKLLREGNTPEEIKDLIIAGNLYGAPNENRARRIYGYISNRVALLNEQGINLFFSSDLNTQKLLNLICIIRGDRLFFEFLNEVYREKNMLGFEYLEISDAKKFFTEKERQSDVVSNWNDTTKRKLQSGYFNYMIDANLLSVDQNKKRITPPILDIALERYLEANNETAIIKAITGVY